MKRVVVTGSESTGKTTLAADLARHFGVLWIPEYVRGYLDLKGAPLTVEDVEPIARGQIEEHDRTVHVAAGRADRLIVLDTDLLSTAIYSRHYYGSCPEWIDSEVRRRRADLYLFCDIDVPWTPDTQRDRPQHRAELQAMFREALDRLGGHVVDVRGSWSERFAIAVRAVASS